MNDFDCVVIEEECVKRFVGMEIVNVTEAIVLQVKRFIELLVFVSLLVSQADEQVFFSH